MKIHNKLEISDYQVNHRREFKELLGNSSLLNTYDFSGEVNK